MRSVSFARITGVQVRFESRGGTIQARAIVSRLCTESGLVSREPQLLVTNDTDNTSHTVKPLGDVRVDCVIRAVPDE